MSPGHKALVAKLRASPFVECAEAADAIEQLDAAILALTGRDSAPSMAIMIEAQWQRNAQAIAAAIAKEENHNEN